MPRVRTRTWRWDANHDNQVGQDGSRPYAPALLRDTRELLNERFGIGHTTIQIEPEQFEECRATC